MTKDEFLNMLADDFKKVTSHEWWVHYPGRVYANDMYFAEPVTVAGALDRIIDWLGDEPIPDGTEVWSVDVAHLPEEKSNG